MMKLTKFRLVGVDFILISLSFFVINHFKRNSLSLPEGYGLLLGLFYGAWMLSAVIGKKFEPAAYKGFRAGAGTLFKSAVYLNFTLVFVVVMFGLAQYSRVQVFATCGALLGLELLVWAVAAHFGVKPQVIPKDEDEVLDEEVPALRNEFSFKFAMVDLGLFFVAFFVVNYLKRGHFDLLPAYDRLMVMQLVLGAAASIATRKFYVIRQKNLYFALWQWLKAGILLMATTGVMVYVLRLFYYSRLQGFGTIVMLMGLEGVALLLYFAARKHKKLAPDIESVSQVQKILKQEHYNLEVNLEAIRQRLMAPCTHKLLQFFELEHLPFYEFLSTHVDLKDILCVETMVDQKYDPFSIREDHPFLRLYISMHKINDCRRLNTHFLQLHQMLMPRGIFTGYAHTIKTHYGWIYNRYPRTLAHAVYALDFLIHRVFPKLPGIQKVYFIATRGRNRVISRAEILGRLCFCGFDIVATREIDNRFYFIARKVKTVSLDKSPTYGPLVTLKRAGLGGNVVHTYKFRTMHPYSEYLQQYMYDQNGLQKGGKIENDFRMTTWGKVMRKLWLDELPMLYNWLKGDFGLVGVRPLSFQYLSLYDPDLQALRQKVRPGLVPPFYADLPETFEEICDSERRYIESFLAHPIKTQIRYFIKSFINIVFKGARSK